MMLFRLSVCLGLFLHISTALGQSLDVEAPHEWPDEFLHSPARITRATGIFSFDHRILVIGANLPDHPSLPGQPLSWLDERGWTADLGFRFHSEGPPVGVQWNDHLVLAGELPFTPHPSRTKARGSTGLNAFNGQVWNPVDPGFSGRVQALAVWQGDLVVAGNLTIEGHPELSSLARWNGTSWQSLGGQPSGVPNPRILTLTVHEDQLVAAGLFSRMGDTRANNLALFDGSEWSTAGSGSDRAILQAASWQGDLFVSGDFTCIGGEAIEKLARWNGSRWFSMLPEGNPPRYSFRHTGYDLLATAEGLLVRGPIAGVNQQGVCYLARWKENNWDQEFPWYRQWIKGMERGDQIRNVSQNSLASASTPKDWASDQIPELESPGPLSLREISSMVLHDGDLVAYSNLDRHNNPYPGRVDRLKNGGWQSLLPELNPAGRPEGVYRGELLLALDKGQGHSPLGTWNGQDVCELGPWPADQDSPELQSIAVQGDSVFVAGNFHSFAGQPWHQVALFDGEDWKPLSSGVPFDQVTHARLQVTDTMVFLTGSFLNQGQNYVRGIASWDGESWSFEATSRPGQRGGYRYGSCPSGFFRSIGVQATEYLMTPDHHPLAFARESFPIIEQWSPDGWYPVWMGRTGSIRQFHRDGNSLWALVSHGIDENLLKYEAGRWETISNVALGHKEPNKMNDLSRLVVCQGVPIVGGDFDFPGKTGNSGHAHFMNGQWNLFPSPPHSLWQWWPIDQRIWFSGYSNNSCDPVSLTYWDGPLPANPIIQQPDIDQYYQLLKACRNADQSRTPRVDDLPAVVVPREHVRPERPDNTTEPGWYLTSWPEGHGVDDFVWRKGDQIVLNPGYSGELFWQEYWPKGESGLVEFEYRLEDPQGWVFPGSHPSDEIHPHFGEVEYPAHCNSRGNGGNRVALLSVNDEWKKARLAFVGDDWSSGFFIDPGKSYRGKGRIRIRNVRYEKGEIDFTDLVEELKREIREYDWPGDLLGDLERGFQMEPETRETRVQDGWANLLGSSGIHNIWGFHFDTIANNPPNSPNFRSRQHALSRVITNAESGSFRKGWIPGGGLYVKSIHDVRKRERGLIATLEDPLKRKFIKGVVWDMRDGYGGAGISFGPGWYNTASEGEKTLGILARNSVVWCKVEGSVRQKNGKLKKRRGERIIEPSLQQWPAEVPLTVIVDESVSGVMVMMLQAIPGVRTVGRPSARVPVPTRPHLLGGTRWVYLPEGKVFGVDGEDQSFRRIQPDYLVELNAEYDEAIRLALELMGIELDPEGMACPLE